MRQADGYGHRRTGRNFNPRTRVECDRTKEEPGYYLVDFNPRTRVECDHALCRAVIRDGYFNPRTRVECDMLQYAISQLEHFISIHALV